MSSSSKKKTKLIQPDPVAQKQLRALQEDMEKRARNHIDNTMPAKVLHLDQLLATEPLFNLDSPEDIVEKVEVIYQDTSDADENTPAGKRQKVSAEEHKALYGHIKANKKLEDLLALMKREVREAIEIVNSIKVWIQMLVPKMEDGNNFGVEVQEEVSSECDRVETETYMIFESCQAYHKARAKYAEKVLKHPHIEDYRQAIYERDQQEYLRRKYIMVDLRSNYATLYDIIQKNLDKVTKPKGEDMGAGSFNMCM